MTSKQKRLIAGLIGLIFISVLNGTMFNVALPQIMRDYSLSEAGVSWVLISYGLVFAIGAVTYGKLADLFSVKRLILIGVTLFLAGSALGYLTAHTEYYWTIISRVLQASGSSAIPALGMITATKYFPQEKRGMVLGMIASTVAFGMGVGPLLGGVMAQFWDWPFLFLVSLVMIVIVPLVVPALPIETPESGRYDVVGSIVFAAGVALLLIAANTWVWAAIPGLLLFAWFYHHIKRHPDPFIQLKLFRNRGYRLLLIIGFLLFFSLSSSLFLLPLLLEGLHDLQAGWIGAVLFPGTMLAALLGTQAGKLSDQYGSSRIMQGATLLMGGGFALLSLLLGISAWWISFALILMYLGFAANQSSLANYVSQHIERSEAGIGMGLYNLITFVGTTFGPALSSRFLTMHSGPPASSYMQAYALLGVLCVAVWLLVRAVGRNSQQGHTANPSSTKRPLNAKAALRKNLR